MRARSTLDWSQSKIFLCTLVFRRPGKFSVVLTDWYKASSYTYMYIKDFAQILQTVVAQCNTDWRDWTDRGESKMCVAKCFILHFEV